jgi:hypothetical protein
VNCGPFMRLRCRSHAGPTTAETFTTGIKAIDVLGVLCKTGGNHQHKYLPFNELQMLSPLLTGAEQESEQERSKGCHTSLDGPNFDLVACPDPDLIRP